MRLSCRHALALTSVVASGLAGYSLYLHNHITMKTVPIKKHTREVEYQIERLARAQTDLDMVREKFPEVGPYIESVRLQRAEQLEAYRASHG